MEFLTRLATRRPVAMTVFALAIALIGWKSWGLLPVDLLPDVESPTVVVSIRSGDRPPTEMERIYGEGVEKRLFTVRGIRDISQVARTGRIVATVVFAWDADMDLALIEVQKAVSPIGSDPDVDEILVRRFDPRQAPVLTLGLVAPEQRPDLAELRRIARRQVAPALERLEGVAEARVLGGREREIEVRLDRYRLEAFGLTLSSVSERLRAANIDINAGSLEDDERVLLVRGIQRYRDVADVRAVVLHYQRDNAGNVIPVHVSDLAEVHEVDAEITHLVRVDGQEGVALSIYKEAGANTVAVSRTIQRAMEALEGDLPGVRVAIVADEASLVEESISEVQTAALAGICLAVLVLALFLRSFASTLVVSASVPVSLLATLFLMHLGGRTLNIMTLAGLALGAGMLVDNAIVVVESIFRRLSRGAPIMDAAAEGAAEVSGAIGASTLTTCIVFLPVLFIHGLAARLVEGLSFTVIVSLAVSMVVALMLIPALSVWLLPRRQKTLRDPGSSRVAGLVRTFLRVPAIVVALSVLLIGGGIWSLRGLGTELLPPADPQQFSLRVVCPPGQRVEATAQVIAAIEQILEEAAGEDLVAILSEVGRLPEDDRQIREEQSEENTARLLVRLATGGVSGKVIVARAAPAVAKLAGVQASWDVGSSALARAVGSAGPPIRVEITGRSLADLRAGAVEITARMAAREALWNVRSSFEGGPPELRIVLDRSVADGLGVGIDLIADTLSAALDGKRVTEISTGDEEYTLRLRLPPIRRDELASLPLVTSDGKRLALGEIASFVPQAGAREVFRRDQRRVAAVTARIATGADYPAAIDAALAAIDESQLPSGLRAALVGEEEERERSFAELESALLLALVLVFMVLAGKFESLLHPFTILASVPLALVGVAAILVPTGWPVGVMALLGMILLSGIAVNDAILLVDAATRLRQDGMPRQEALAQAAALRLRPILMTTATTVLAMLPLAVGFDEGARLRAPLALTVIGGILASTLASLLVIPCLYDLLDRISWPRGKKSA